MTDEITMDRIMKMLWEVTGFKGDAAQTDAIRVALEAYAAKLAESYGPAPSELIEAHLHSLTTLASQLLDTGGRMRLDPAGQLEDPGNPLATGKDLKHIADSVSRLAASVDSLRIDGAIQRDILIGTLRDQLEPKADKADLASMKATRPDLSQVHARLDRLESAIGSLARDLGPELEEHLNKVGTMMADAELGAVMREPDLSPLQAQLEALTKAVLASQGRHDAEITAMAGDLATLCEDVVLIRASMHMPAAYIPLKPVVPPDMEAFASQMTSATFGFSENEPDPIFRQSALDESLRIIAEIRQEEERQAAPKPADSASKKQAKEKPGCFFNEDGTITCRLCGKAKPREAYYKDKQAWTGRKSACSDCEKARVNVKS